MSATADPVPSEVVRPLKRAEYVKLAETGAFDGERVELLYGRIVTLGPQRERHSYSVSQLALYAQAGVPEYWIVNLVAGVLERHQDPGPQGYERVTPHGHAQELTMSRFADVVVRVAEVLPAV